MLATAPIRTGQTSVPKTVPAPVGGLNGRDPLAAMDDKDAYVMDNLVPGTANVFSRAGSSEFVPTMGAPVKTLDVYTGAAADKLLAWANGSVYNISTGTASSLASGKSTDYVITCMFSNAADTAQHMIIVSGLDTPYHYDGTTIANLTITGITGSVSTLNYVFAFKSRLYFGQKDKLGFYYLAVGAIQGAASFFDLAQVSLLGGYLVAIGSYSTDAGNGPQDYIVFVTSKGEIIMYEGYDPSTAANFQLAGRYFAAPPIGKKCLINYGTELLILTLEGAVPFSQVRRAGDAKAAGVANSEYSALTSKLGTFLSDLNANADVQGWGAIVYPKSNWLILTVPATGSISGAFYHYVMNTKTNAWCRFTGWNGLCMAVYNRNLYFGLYDGRVMLGDTGRDDDGQDIRIDCKQAYNYMDDGSGQFTFLHKHFQWASMLVRCDGEPPISARFNVDYVEDIPEYITNLTSDNGAEWDTTLWDTTLWAADATTQRVIATLNNEGVAGSLWVRASLQGIMLEWLATEYVYERMKVLL